MSNKATRQQRTQAERDLRDAKGDARWHRSHTKGMNTAAGAATRNRAIQRADQRAADAQRTLNQIKGK